MTSVPLPVELSVNSMRTNAQVTSPPTAEGPVAVVLVSVRAVMSNQFCPSFEPWNWYLILGFPPVANRMWTLNVASTFERVKDIVAEQLGVDKEKVAIETSLVNDLGADSLDVVELVMELEEEFDLNIPDDAAEKIQTVGEIVEYIEANSGA